MAARTHVVAGVLASLALASPVLAQERGTADEAQAMLDRALAHYQEVGREHALAAFNDPDGGFRDRDLYVFCFAPDDTMAAHPSSELLGADITGLQDADGQNIGQGILEIGRGAGSGALDYRWANPVSGDVEDKTSLVRAFDDDICAVGYYR